MVVVRTRIPRRITFDLFLFLKAVQRSGVRERGKGAKLGFKCWVQIASRWNNFS